jgi:hypothetical protein
MFKLKKKMYIGIAIPNTKNMREMIGIRDSELA